MRSGWKCVLVTMVVLAACGGTEPPPVPASIRLTSATNDLHVGQSVQATAVVLSASGDELGGQALAWSTSDSLVARVSSMGAILGEGAGSATIGVSSGTVTASLVVRVADLAHSLLFASTAMPSALTGDTTALRVVVRDSLLQPMAARPIRWVSRNEVVATVDANGVVSGHARGRAWVVARSGMVRDSVLVAIIAGGNRPNRDLAFRHFSPIAPNREEVWVWSGSGSFGQRVSAPDRAVQTYRWSQEGEWLLVSYRPAPHSLRLSRWSTWTMARVWALSCRGFRTSISRQTRTGSRCRW